MSLNKNENSTNVTLTPTESKYNNNQPLTSVNQKEHKNNNQNSETPTQFVGHMLPRNRALKHEAAAELLQYATTGCPVDCGKQWSIERLQAAIDSGPCTSAKSKEAIEAC